MSEPIRVKVTVDTAELRHWADRHADAGHHGVAHVLYKFASEGESLTAQAIREAKAEALREFADAHRFPSNWILFRRNDGTGVTVPGLLRETASRIARGGDGQ